MENETGNENDKSAVDMHYGEVMEMHSTVSSHHQMWSFFVFRP